MAARSMATRDRTLDDVLTVQTRIESKVDDLALLLRKYLETGPLPTNSLEADDALEVTESIERKRSETHRTLTDDDSDTGVGEASRPRSGRTLVSSEDPPIRQITAPRLSVTSTSVQRSASSLEGWPQSIELLSRYSSGSYVDVASAILARCSSGGGTTVFSTPSMKSSNAIDITPNSSFFMLWALLMIIVVILDSAATSFFLVWDMTQRGALKTAFAACWTLDVIASCCKEKRGSEGHILHLRESLRHYLKTWFALDFSLVCLDWTVIIHDVYYHSDLSKWSIINFLRLYKCVLFVEELTTLKSNYRIVVLLNFLSALVYTIWSLHVFSCFWLWIGIYGFSDTSRHWIDTAGSDFGDFLAAPDFYQYTTSAHWVVSYANLGNIEMYCQNSVERICCVVFMLGSVYVATIAVTVLAGVLFDFYLNHRDQRHQLHTLRRFLNENNIDSHVAGLVMGQATKRLSRLTAKLAYTDVRCLSLLSSAVLRELKYALAGRVLEKHSLFGLWMRCKATLAKDLSMATDFSIVAPGATLFKPLVEGNEMFYLIIGDMVFIQDGSTSLVKSPKSVPVDVGTWFCEAAMWTQWMHVGTIEAIDSCELCTLHADAVGRVLRQDEVMFRIAAAYAEAFHYRLITAGPPHTDWPDDLRVPLTQYADLVMQLPPDLLVYIGIDAVEVLSKSQKSWLSGQMLTTAKTLRNEVTTGKCVLMVNALGEVKRVTSVLTLRLENSSGQILYQLGKLTAQNEFEVEFKLPGKKRELGESISDTINRSPKLKKLCGASDLVREESHEKFEYSHEYGIDTHYLLTMRVAQLHDHEIIDVFLPDPDLIRENTALRQEVEELNRYIVGSIVGIEERTVCAWLDGDMAEHLQHKSREVLIHAWMSRFDLLSCFLERLTPI